MKDGKSVDDCIRQAVTCYEIRDQEGCESAIQAVTDAGEPAVGPLIDLLSEEGLTGFALYTLMRIGEPSVPALTDLLGHEQHDTIANLILTASSSPAATEA